MNILAEQIAQEKWNLFLEFVTSFGGNMQLAELYGTIKVLTYSIVKDKVLFQRGYIQYKSVMLRLVSRIHFSSKEDYNESKMDLVLHGIGGEKKSFPLLSHTS